MRHAIAWFVFTAAVLATACTEQRESPTSPSATKPVNAPAVATLSKLEVAPSVLGGQTARATVTLSEAAPAGGVAISLSSSGTAATVPSSLTIPAGATTAGFDVATTRVTMTADVT